MLQKRIIRDVNMNAINRYYERYDFDNQEEIGDRLIEHLLVYKKNFSEIEGNIPKDLYRKLEIRK